MVLKFFYIHIWKILKFATCSSSSIMKIAVSVNAKTESISVQTTLAVSRKVWDTETQIATDLTAITANPCTLQRFLL
jgi:hypothetical protein